MKSFKTYISEAASTALYFHGTHKKNVASFKKGGLKASEQSADKAPGVAFVSPRPDVALGYAFMQGGEQSFSGNVKEEDRALIVFKIPSSWISQHKAWEQGGLLPEISFDAGIPAKFIVDTVVGRKPSLDKYSDYLK